ncbi:MAG: hypothetical protein V7721_05010 [Porticoccaceae bacterium]
MSLFRWSCLLGVLLLISGAKPAQANIVWHWPGSFTESEQAKLTHWIELTIDGVEKKVAPYPFDVHIFFHRLASNKEPVPWANTQRSGRQAVHFYVDPQYSLSDFLKDWTAPHELSHLLIPYVGSEYSWFAEGFASYMQYQVMEAMGVISSPEVSKRYRRHISRAKNRFNFHRVPFVSAASRLRTRGDYVTLYWGGAVYFLQVDRALKSNGSSLIGVLESYVTCCRAKHLSFKYLIQEFDRLSSGTEFSSAMQAFTSTPGFPAYSEGL